MSHARMGDKVMTLNGAEVHVLKLENGIRIVEIEQFFTEVEIRQNNWKKSRKLKIELDPKQAIKLARELGQ